MYEKETLEDQIKNLARSTGADLVGICSAESIKSKPFSDPLYLLPDAQSVVSIAIKFSKEKVKKYLSKEDHEPLRLEEGLITRKLKKIGGQIKDLLQAKDFKAVNCDVNFDYRNVDKKGKSVVGAFENLIALVNKDRNPDMLLTEKEKKQMAVLKKMIYAGLRQNPLNYIPYLSHKCVAEAAGLGRIGWSGNLVTPQFGARVLLNSVVTNARLTPDKHLATNPCNLCKLCEKVCQGGIFERDKSQEIEIAGVKETIGKRNSIAYCVAVCGGFIGQNKFKEWSTWSPFRLEKGQQLPKDDSIDNFVRELFIRGIDRGGAEAENVLRLIKDTYFGLDEDKPLDTFNSTCAMCQLVCGATQKEKKESYQTLSNSGYIK